MEPNDEIIRLLTELRDGQRESINEYKRLQESYDARFQEMIRRQQKHLAIFAVLVFILGAVVAAEIALREQVTEQPTSTFILPNPSAPAPNPPKK
jgi:hypothetical protein